MFIAACAICLAGESAVRFTRPVWRPDLGLALPCLEGAAGAPLDLPRAEAYLVTRDGASFLEDRYDSFDLWTVRTLRGRWRDAAGNQLFLARLDSRPLGDAPGTTRTRRSFRSALESRRFNPKDAAQRDEAAELVSPVELGSAARPRRAQRRNFAELVAYSTPNERAVVFAFRPVDPERKGSAGDWYLAALLAAPGEDMAEVRARFDEDFLDRVFVPTVAVRRKWPHAPQTKADDDATEAELLRADVRAQVANYDEWASADSADVTVLDNLDEGLRARFVASLTNALPRLRRAYAECVPSPLVSTNALAVVRVFRSREEYLAYVGIDKKWTAAIWSPVRRELVLYHPEAGVEKLLRTVWHEAFHQYMAYAGSMIESSPWFNEGHAQLFENAHLDAEGRIAFDRDEQACAYVHEYAAELAEILPEVLEMDYDEFYSGTQEDVAAKYRLVWSIAYFLEVGAPKLRFQPYASFRADYMKALIETRSMHGATRAVLGDEKSRDAFVAAWRAFWREQ
ncbi:MAG: hypothetical protein ACI4RA_00880 [Kiritimatiellia bacterium]